MNLPKTFKEVRLIKTPRKICEFDKLGDIFTLRLNYNVKKKEIDNVSFVKKDVIIKSGYFLGFNYKGDGILLLKSANYLTAKIVAKPSNITNVKIEICNIIKKELENDG